MDTSDLSSIVVFITFLALFIYLRLVERSSHAGEAPVTEGVFSSRLVNALRGACVIAITLSWFALLYADGFPKWWSLSLFAAGLFAGLVILDSAAEAFAGRFLAHSGRLSLPMRRALPPYLRRKRSRAGRDLAENHGDAGDEAGDLLPEEIITEKALEGLDQQAREMLRSVVALDTSTAREIMVPRLDIVAVEASFSFSGIAEKVVQYGHSRLPVYEETIDHILGILHTRDLIMVLAQEKSTLPLKDLIRPAFFIPETKRLDELLKELRARGMQMAIVVDEYGGTEGLVTMEDLLEEIVGEIEDEFSATRSPQLVHLPDGAAIVDAGVTLDDIGEVFSTRIESEDVDTVGGYVYQALGKIPQVGDKVATDHLSIEVVSILGRRLRKLHIRRLDSEPGASKE